METFDFDAIMEKRRTAVEQSLRPISSDELKSLGEEIFPYPDDSWREAFFTFIEENAGSTFYYATTQDRIHVLYCRDKDKGMWFMPGRGKGRMQVRGLAIMKEIVDQL